MATETGPFDLGQMSSGEYTAGFDSVSGEIVNLGQWLGQFQYRDDLDYVRLTRVRPAADRESGIPIGGALEDLDGPVEVQDIRKRWGGGLYRLDAWQLVEGRLQQVAKGLLRVSGRPRCYINGEGKRARIPSSITDEEREAAGNGRGEAGASQRGNGAMNLVDIAQAMARGGDSAEHAKVMADVIARYGSQSQEAASTLARIQGEHAKMLREQQQQADGRIQSTIAMMQDRARQELDNLRAQLDAMREQHRDQLESTRTAQREQIEALREQHRIERDALQRDINVLRDQLNTASTERVREVSEQRASAQQREAELRALYEQRERDLRSDYEQRESRLVADFDRRIAAVQRQQERLEDAQEKRVDAARDVEARHHESLAALRESENTRLQAELTAARTEIAELRAQVTNQASPQQKVGEVMQLAEMVKTLGGSGGGADPPTDFLGKLAHYGPKLADTFVSPVLRRVDSAMDVARQQSARGGVPVVTTRGVRQISHQLPGSGQIPVVPGQPIPGQYPAPAPMAPAPTPEPERREVPSEQQQQQEQQEPMDGRGFLGMLADRLDAGRTPSDIVQEIRDGIDAGYIPEEQVRAIAEADADAVVVGIQQDAGSVGLDILTTPRARGVLSEVHAGLRESYRG